MKYTFDTMIFISGLFHKDYNIAIKKFLNSSENNFLPSSINNELKDKLIKLSVIFMVILKI